MYSIIKSCAVFGVEGTTISVEADVNDGLPMFNMVGHLSSSVKEASERVRTSLKNLGYRIPPKRITINLYPADFKKDGCLYDLPIAISILVATGLMVQIDLEKTMIVGELTLNGIVKPVHGILPMVSFCKEQGFESCIVPFENEREASLVQGIRIIGVRSLAEAISFLGGDMPEKVENTPCSQMEYKMENADFSMIKGQYAIKRGLEIAAAGFHNVLMSGAAGAGKTMLAKCLNSIMPDMSFEECLAVTKIYSIKGLLDEDHYMIQDRPFRAPHHSITAKALIGGGTIPTPGEVSLAHKGILFLDELPEFPKQVLENLRQPMEEGRAVISRIHGNYIFPADFMLVAAMNPCPCGNYPNLKKCTCSMRQIQNYRARISEPLMDRIDIRMEVKPVPKETIFSKEGSENSATIKQRVLRARELQKSRYAGENIMFNAQLRGDKIEQFVPLAYKEKQFLMHAYEVLNLSMRGMHRIVRLARTIADLDGQEMVTQEHLQEALFYRNGEMPEKE